MLAAAILAAALAPAGGRQPARLSFQTPDRVLAAAFEWARRQALDYVSDGDPVGPWYEAALPGREAFCMRDVSHQAMGAHALGLARYTRNMLRRFAGNVSDSKDWCSYWEINRNNQPAPADYRSDAEFWYNLPANFDVLDCCYRMYEWTGDTAYLSDPVFLNFYERTVKDYVERWDLDPGRVMSRQRFLNERGAFDPSRPFQFYRGDPSYQENREPFVLGVDLLATQYAGYLAYSRIQELRGDVDSARTYRRRAEQVRSLVNGSWWDAGAHRFRGFLSSEHRLEGWAGSDLLYRDVVEDGPKLRSALDDLLAAIRERPSSSVEGQSHHAEILYRYGVPDVAYAQMIDLAREDRNRREYPEVSYSIVGAIVTGLMGVRVESEPSGGGVLRTLPALCPQTAWAALSNLPVHANLISVRHDGNRRTTLINQKGSALIWQATFDGSFPTLLVNGRRMNTRQEKGFLGRALSWVRVPVGAGDSVRVEAP